MSAGLAILALLALAGTMLAVGAFSGDVKAVRHVKAVPYAPAIPVASASAAAPCADALCVLNPTANSALNVSGGATITVQSIGPRLFPGIIVNSSSGDAADVSGGSNVDADAETNVHGGFHTSGGGRFTANVSPAVSSGAPQVTDPFTSLPVPAVGPSKGSLVTDSTVTAQPGTYSSLGAQGGKLTLAPGVYVITQGLEVSGNAQLLGDGVMLYFTVGAGIHFSGGSVVNITAPSSGTYQGLSVFFARTDTAGFVSDGAPTPANPAQRQINGAIYAKASQFDIQELDADGQVVVDTVNVHSGGFLAAGA
ncbi:MAG: hypothetical protein ACYDHH_23320 [Solirubrobacteraceae bacterium]